MSKPKIAITMGDPTGIGPEIIVKAIETRLVEKECTLIVIGRPSILRHAAHTCSIDLEVVELQSIEQWDQDLTENEINTPLRVACLVTGNADADQAVVPIVDARGGQLAFDCLCKATELALASQVDAIVTAPLHKVALHQAGHDWPGHTELLASLCGIQDYAMMLYLPPANQASTSKRYGGIAGLGVVHVTLHMALRDVFEHLSTEAIEEKIHLAHNVFSRIRNSLGNSERPRLAVAALNPHGGEGGRFGNEERTIIEPAVLAASASGIDVVGPLPVDTLMPKAAAGDYDAVIAMYHDQGHIALKLLDMFDAVNITLGLPILRSSVAHGTAHDIAWQNKAEPSGMVQAVLTAARMCTRLTGTN